MSLIGKYAGGNAELMSSTTLKLKLLLNKNRNVNCCLFYSQSGHKMHY